MSADDTGSRPDSDGAAQTPSLLGRVVPEALRSRYVAKFVVAIAVVVVLISAVGTVGYAQTQAQIEDSTERQLTSTAELHADSMAEWLTGIETQTVLLSGSERLRGGSPSEIDTYLQTKRYSLSLGVQHIHYVNASSGRIEASTRPGYDRRALSTVDAPWGSQSFYDGVTRTTSVRTANASYYSGELGGQVLPFASPVLGQDGGYIVVVGLLQYELERLHQPIDGGETVILNDAGETVVGNGSAGVAGDDFDGNASATHFERRGDEVLAYTGVQGTDWTVVTTAPTASAFAVRDAVGRNVLQIVLVSLLGLGVVGVALGRHTVSPIQRLQRRAAAMADGDLDVDLRTTRTDEIGELHDGFATMRDSLKRRIEEAETARADAERARSEAEALNDHLEQKAAHYSTVMQAVGDGDLTREMDPESESEAMTRIAREFNGMRGELAATLEQVQTFARTVAASGEEVSTSAEEVEAASEQVSRSIQTISEEADHQHDELESILDEMNSLSATIEEITTTAESVSELAAETAEAGRSGQDDAAAAIEDMDAIVAESSEAVAEIQDLEAVVTRIDELVEVIQDVTERTQVLSLNANIEASRVDEEGSDGFVPVAQEIKDLSEETKEATAAIEARLEEIQAQTESTAAVVRRTRDRIGTSTDSVAAAVEDLEAIAAYAEQTEEGVRDIRQATQQQAEMTERVVTRVDETAAISEQTTVESEKVAAAAEEQTSALTGVVDSVTDLAGRAGRLRETLEQFETEEEGGTDRPTPSDASTD